MSEDLFPDSASYWHATIPPMASSVGDLPTTADVVVVGGGLLGVATAYWLARAGAAPVLLEGMVLASGATGRNAGMVGGGAAMPYPALVAQVGHQAARDIWALTLQNRALLREVLALEAIDCDYREPSHLGLALDPERLAAFTSSASTLAADGFAAEILERAQVQELVGTPLGPEIIGGILWPEHGLVHSARLVHGLARAASRHRAQIYTGTPVIRLEGGPGGITIETPRGRLWTRSAVVAVNAWTDQLVPALAGVVTPMRGQMLAYAPTAPVFTTAMYADLSATGEYWQQTPDGTILLGGCRGVAPGHEIGIRSSQPTREVQVALEQVLPRLFPALGGLRVERRWAGPMAFTPDHLPVADLAPGLPGAWVVGGFNGHGMPFGMRLGQLLAQAATTGNPPAALAPFRLGRPALQRPA